MRDDEVPEGTAEDAEALLDRLEAIEEAVERLLTPQELAIRRLVILGLFDLDWYLDDSAGGEVDAA